MTLTPEQNQAVVGWAAAGDSLSAIQKKLTEQFKLSMTYMEVRFLVDDLGLELKNATQPASDPKADLTAAKPVEKKPGLFDKLKKAVGAGDAKTGENPLSDDEFADDDLPDELPPAGAGKITIDVDIVVRPGMVVSGSVTFSDGVAGKWALDQHGRLMLDTGKKGYQPSAPDVQAFQRELSVQLQKRGY